MHTYDGKTVTFIYHGDVQDNMYIVGKTRDGEEVEIILDAQDVLDFVAYKYVLPEKIGKLEQMEAKELLLGEGG